MSFRSLSILGTLALGLSVFLGGCDAPQRSTQGATVARSSSSPRTFNDDVPLSVPTIDPSERDPAVAPASALLPVPAAAPARQVRMPTRWQADLGWNAAERLAHAKRERTEVVEDLFEKAGV